MFIGKDDIYREGKYDWLRQYCPQFDPLFTGVMWENGHEPVPVMKSAVVARVAAESAAAEKAKAEEAVAESVMTPLQKAVAELNEMPWRKLVSYAKTLGIKTLGITKDKLVLATAEAKLALEAQ